MIKIKLEGDQELIDNFMSWLDNQGEQDYWMYAECAGHGEATINRFAYDCANNEITGKRRSE